MRWSSLSGPGGRPLDWRGLARQVGVGGAAGLAGCVFATMIGFRLNIPFVVVLVMIGAAGVWVLRQVESAGPTAGRADVVSLQARNPDPGVRQLEVYLYGSQPHNRLATPQLQRVVADLVDQRTSAGADRSRVSTDLRAYLDAAPAPPVDRDTIRRFIREIAAL